MPAKTAKAKNVTSKAKSKSKAKRSVDVRAVRAKKLAKDPEFRASVRESIESDATGWTEKQARKVFSK